MNKTEIARQLAEQTIRQKQGTEHVQQVTGTESEQEILLKALHQMQANAAAQARLLREMDTS